MLATVAVAVAQEPPAGQQPKPPAPKPTVSIEELQQRITDLENAARASGVVLPQDQLQRGKQSPIRDRDGLYDRQVAAARLDDLTLEPEYNGFMPVPNTPLMMRFNAKPRLDATFDSRNTGNSDRFVPGLIPVPGEADFGGGRQFSLNANGTQLSFDVRAPETPGNFRFYYQNDFFAQVNADMKYRLQHAYGQYYNIIAGFTYGLFEDPDIWPDTVDYEGTNSTIFARRPVIHYKTGLCESWILTLGVENPDIYVDTVFDPTVSLLTRRPDLGFNLRFEDADVGHSQFSAIYRSIGANGTTVGEQTDNGWGLNWSLGLNVTEVDSMQVLLVGGEGIAGLGNDSGFFQSDGAFTAAGELQALGYYSVMFGFTHRWCPDWRSTATYGFAALDNVSGQAGDSFESSQYASVNLIHMLGPRFSVGGELLYGQNERFDGRDGDAWRFQLGLVYSLF